jgi:hypothetical protein
MLITINKEVEAAIVFKSGLIFPVWIKIDTEKVKFEKVIYKWNEKKGEQKIIKFTLLSNKKIYELSFNTDTLKWHLEAIDE